MTAQIDDQHGHEPRAEVVRYQRGGDGVVTLVLDDPSQGVNTMNAGLRRIMGRAVRRLRAERDDIAGVVVTSAKKTFFAGGDLVGMSRATPTTPQRCSPRSSRSRPTCARSRPSAVRSSLLSTAARSAAGSR